MILPIIVNVKSPLKIITYEKACITVFRAINAHNMNIEKREKIRKSMLLTG